MFLDLAKILSILSALLLLLSSTILLLLILIVFQANILYDLIIYNNKISNVAILLKS